MSQPRIVVHFAPGIATRVSPHFKWWADAIRSWHDDGDPDSIFGRDECNHPDGYTQTWARHMHVVPSPGIQGLNKWESAKRKYDRTSDRLLIYSMSVEYGVLLLALLGDPNGHDKLTKGAAAQERRQTWEDLAHAHQKDGDLPEGTISDQ